MKGPSQAAIQYKHLQPCQNPSDRSKEDARLMDTYGTSWPSQLPHLVQTYQLRTRAKSYTYT